MIKVSVLYKSTPDAPFNMDYYLQKHTPMVLELLADSLRALTIDRGLSGPMPGSEPTYDIIANLHFDAVEDFQMAFLLHGAALMADIPNYSPNPPIIQISEVIR